MSAEDRAYIILTFKGEGAGARAERVASALIGGTLVLVDGNTVELDGALAEGVLTPPPPPRQPTFRGQSRLPGDWA